MRGRRIVFVVFICLPLMLSRHCNARLSAHGYYFGQNCHSHFYRPTRSLTAWPCRCDTEAKLSTRTVAEAVTVLIPVRADEPPFSTTISVTVAGTPACPTFMVT